MITKDVFKGQTELRTKKALSYTLGEQKFSLTSILTIKIVSYDWIIYTKKKFDVQARS